MPRGSTRSTMTLMERRRAASSLYLKGFSISEIARKLNVTWDTAKAYKAWHENFIRKEVAANPQILSDVIRNTVEMLAELDQVRSAAWRTYHTTSAQQIKLQALNTIRSAQQDKAKLYGLFGVKHEFFVMVANVRTVQDRILEFMARELCDHDRRKLEELLTSPEMAQYTNAPALASIPSSFDDTIIEAELVQDVG